MTVYRLVPESIWSTNHRLANKSEWPPRTPAEADRFLEQAAIEGLLPLAFADDSLPAAVVEARKRYGALHRVHLRRVDVLTDVFRRIAKILEGEPFVVLKGTDFRHRLYLSPELRPAQDVDLLVPRSRINAVRARLKQAGYRQYYSEGGRGRLPQYMEIAFDIDGVLLEIHKSVNYRHRVPLDYRAMWDRRVPATIAGVDTFRLTDSDCLLLHAVNLAKDECSAPLIRYVDAWLMLRGNEQLAHSAAEDARRWNAQSAMYAMLTLTIELLPELNRAVLDEVRQRLLSSSRRRFLERQLPDPRIEQAGHIRGRRVQLWRKLWLIDGWPRRVGSLLFALYALAAGYFLERLHPTRAAETN